MSGEKIGIRSSLSDRFISAVEEGCRGEDKNGTVDGHSEPEKRECRVDLRRQGEEAGQDTALLQDVVP